MALIVRKHDNVASAMEKKDLILRMRNDPILWIENDLKIRTKTGDLIPFQLNSFQRKLVSAVMDSIKTDGDAFFVVLKGRQLGISSICRTRGMPLDPTGYTGNVFLVVAGRQVISHLTSFSTVSEMPNIQKTTTFLR